MSNEERSCRMIVLADDITGAAEMAGMAFARGLEVHLLTALPPESSVACGFPAGITVIATDTRSMTEAEAVAETRRIAASFPVSHLPNASTSQFLIFKKTDSALRGHVTAELSTLMASTGHRRAVFLPANPSKGRIITDGVYYIKEKKGQQDCWRPIHTTDFSFDPEFPATTSVMSERFPEAEDLGIIMPDATSADDISRVVTQYNDGHTLFAGAADLFQAFLMMHPQPSCQRHPPVERESNQALSRLILCGSTQSTTLSLGIPLSYMPLAIYDGSSDLTPWLADAKAKYESAGSLVLAMEHHHRTGKDAAVHLRQMMAHMACRLMQGRQPHHLVIEGGATAFATLSQMGWQQFTVMAQPAPGVVTLQGERTPLVTLKPGSYPWPADMMHAI